MLKHLNRIRYHIRDFIDYLRAFRRKEHTDLRVTKVTSEDYLLAAKRLHAEVYLYRNFITDKDIRDGIIVPRVDPYQPHSQYFVVLNKNNTHVIATARQIQAKKAKSHNSFAMVTHTKLYDRAKKTILSYPAVDCVEISGLAKHRGVSKLAPLLLYRAMLHHSIEHEHRLWLLACDVKLFIRLKLLFGPAIQKAGPTTFYLGSNVVPVILRLETCIQEMHKALEKGNIFERMLRYRVARFILKGIPEDKISPRELKALYAIRHFR